MADCWVSGLSNWGGWCRLLYGEVAVKKEAQVCSTGEDK